jgi:hypothetical protein
MTAIPLYPSAATSRSRGVALLMVLIIVLAITIITTGFLARADVELACGQNMLMRSQVDHLADSALEHAKGLLLHPQEISGTYWTGATGLQLVAGSSDYYDVAVTRDPADYCNYNIACEAYRLKDGQKAGRCALNAVLRFDPCVGFWTLMDTSLRQNWVLHGDLFTPGGVVNEAVNASLDGDVFATTLSGKGCIGQTKPYTTVPMAWPPVTNAYVNPSYTSTDLLADTVSSSSTLTRIWRRSGNLTVTTNVTFQGMLLVTGDLTIVGSEVEILAAKNLPALYVGGNLVLEGVNDLTVQGLAVVDGDLYVGADVSNVKFVGGLCLRGAIYETSGDLSGYDNAIRLCGDPNWAAGAIGNALNVDGVGEYARTDDSSSQLQLAGDYTLSLWMKAAATQDDDAGVLVRCSPAGDAIHWGLQFNSANPKMLVVRHLSDGGEAWSTGVTLAEIAGAWHHIAVTRGATTMTSYLDGVLRTSDAWTYASGTGDGHVNLGANAAASTTTMYTGSLDDVRVYDRTLVEAEVAQVKIGQSVASPIGHWRLDGPGSSVTIEADPLRASIASWPSGASNPAVHWTPAGGAFFRSVQRQLP